MERIQPKPAAKKREPEIGGNASAFPLWDQWIVYGNVEVLRIRGVKKMGDEYFLDVVLGLIDENLYTVFCTNEPEIVLTNVPFERFKILNEVCYYMICSALASLSENARKKPSITGICKILKRDAKEDKARWLKGTKEDDAEDYQALDEDTLADTGDVTSPEKDAMMEVANESKGQERTNLSRGPKSSQVKIFHEEGKKVVQFGDPAHEPKHLDAAAMKELMNSDDARVIRQQFDEREDIKYRIIEKIRPYEIFLVAEYSNRIRDCGTNLFNGQRDQRYGYLYEDADGSVQKGMRFGKLSAHYELKNKDRGSQSQALVLIHLCNLIMGSKFYVSKTHFHLNYCIGAQQTMSQIDHYCDSLNLSKFNYMLFDDAKNSFGFYNVSCRKQDLRGESDFRQLVRENFSEEGIYVFHGFQSNQGPFFHDDQCRIFVLRATNLKKEEPTYQFAEIKNKGVQYMRYVYKYYRKGDNMTWDDVLGKLLNYVHLKCYTLQTADQFIEHNSLLQKSELLIRTSLVHKINEFFEEKSHEDAAKEWTAIQSKTVPEIMHLRAKFADRDNKLLESGHKFFLEKGVDILTALRYEPFMEQQEYTLFQMGIEPTRVQISRRYSPQYDLDIAEVKSEHEYSDDKYDKRGEDSSAMDCDDGGYRRFFGQRKKPEHENIQYREDDRGTHWERKRKMYQSQDTKDRGLDREDDDEEMERSPRQKKGGSKRTERRRSPEFDSRRKHYSRDAHMSSGSSVRDRSSSYDSRREDPRQEELNRLNQQLQKEREAKRYQGKTYYQSMHSSLNKSTPAYQPSYQRPGGYVQPRHYVPSPSDFVNRSKPQQMKNLQPAVKVQPQKGKAGPTQKVKVEEIRGKLSTFFDELQNWEPEDESEKPKTSEEEEEKKRTSEEEEKKRSSEEDLLGSPNYIITESENQYKDDEDLGGRSEPSNVSMSIEDPRSSNSRKVFDHGPHKYRVVSPNVDLKRPRDPQNERKPDKDDDNEGDPSQTA